MFMTLDDSILTEAKGTRDQLLDLQHQADRARIDLHHAIRRLHAAGGSLREIAEALGLSHQRVHQIVDTEEGPQLRRRHHGRSRRRSHLERFTRRAWEVVALAEEEARGLRHNYVGTEHLLLGLLRQEEGAAKEVLGSFEITLERVRTKVAEVVGECAESRRRRLPYTRPAKRALEGALREAATLKHSSLESEHVLLGLLGESEGLAIEVLAALGASPDQVRGQVLSRLGE